MSAATESERSFGTGMEVVLEVVRMAANQQYRTMMPVLYADARATDPTPFLWTPCG